MTIDLKLWKLTLPTGAKGKPNEYSGADLTGLKNGPWFERLPDGPLRFRAAVNGVTTKKSKNPRAELRELTPGGKDWSSSSGCHILTVTTAATHLPNPRSAGDAAVVCAQIHGSSNDVTVFRVEDGKVWVTKGNTNHHALADGNYKLGTPFEARFVVWQDKVTAYYNGRPVVTIPGKFTGAYFKAGAYTQANCGNSKPCSADNYGEAVIYSLSVSHTANLPTQVPPSPPPASPPAPPAPAGTRVVQIIRHGEKPSDSNIHTLSDRGYERAFKIAWLFTRDNLPERGLYRPDRLAASKGNTSSMRMVQTLTPLAGPKALNLPISSQYDWENAEKEVAAWLKAQAGVTLACGEHSALVAVGKEFKLSSGKLPGTWPDDRFDVVWVFVSTDGGKTWAFHQVPEMLLLPGDKTVGI